MNITITEAMRLKNEIAKTVNTLNYEVRQAPLGITKEDDVVLTNETDGNKFNDAMTRLIKALSISEEINNSLSAFNRDNKIDMKVRAMQNQKMLYDIYEKSLPKTKAMKTSRMENLGNGVRKAVKVEYTPIMTSSVIKSKINEYKTSYRTLQSDVEKLNASIIELSFSYEDVENLISSSEE